MSSTHEPGADRAKNCPCCETVNTGGRKLCRQCTVTRFVFDRFRITSFDGNVSIQMRQVDVVGGPTWRTMWCDSDWVFRSGGFEEHDLRDILKGTAYHEIDGEAVR